MKFVNIWLAAMSALKFHPSDYCDIETTDGFSTIVMKNRSMVTFVRYDGLLSTITPPVFNKMVNHVDKQLSGLMSKNGYAIGCVFRKDLDAHSTLKKVEIQQKNTADNLRLDLHDLIEENIQMFKKMVYDEEVYFALITNPNVLDDLEFEASQEEQQKYESPLMKNSQNLTAGIEVLRSKHIAFVEKFLGAFGVDAFYSKVEVVNILDALNFIRHQVSPDRSSRSWIPSVPIGDDVAKALGIDGYRTPTTWTYTKNLDDLSHVLPPPLPKQIMSSSINIYGVKEGLPKNTISVGGRLYSAFVMDIPPTQPSIFNNLFSAFNQAATEDANGEARSMPFSICYLITSDGMAGKSLKQMLTMFMAKVPKDTNANIQAAFKQLNFLRKSRNEAIVSLQISAMTWVDDTPYGRKELRTLKTRLANTMEAWGGMTVIENVGDPVLLYQSNILGLSQKHQGTKATLPLARALELLPITRPASAFPNGTVLHCTLDNKIMPLEKFSSNMTAWATVLVGRQGSGKSVSLNNLLFESCIMPGLRRLPLITIIDKGISSTGFINLLYDSLPVNERHLVVSRQLRKSKEYAINPFDIRPGLQFPLENERSQMIAFLTALLTPNERDTPYEDTDTFVGRLVDEVFLQFSETDAASTPKMYVTGINSELDRIVIDNKIIQFGTKMSFDELGEPRAEPDITRYDETSYLGLVRKLHFEAEKYKPNSPKYIELMRGRDLAQRYAVPILSDFGPILNQPKIVNTYKNQVGVGGGETIVEYTLRAIADIESSYPCFCNPTEFDVDTARVVALDLQQVISESNRKQTSLFYQVARMVGVKKFALTEEDIKAFPPMFKGYYTQLVADIKEDKKILAIDEMHNAATDMTFIRVIDKDVREGRKWGLELIFGSQRLTDFDFGHDENSIKMLSGISQVCMCSDPTEDEFRTFQNFFTKNEAVAAITPMIGLTHRGLTFLSFSRAKSGNYTTLLTLPIGGKRLWSLTTDQDERLIRDYMYDLAGSRRHAIAALSYFFQGGSGKERISQIRRNLESKMSNRDEVKAAHGNMVYTLAQTALSSYDDYLAKQTVIMKEREKQYE